MDIYIWNYHGISPTCDQFIKRVNNLVSTMPDKPHWHISCTSMQKLMLRGRTVYANMKQVCISSCFPSIYLHLAHTDSSLVLILAAEFQYTATMYLMKDLMNMNIQNKIKKYSLYWLNLHNILNWFNLSSLWNDANINIHYSISGHVNHICKRRNARKEHKQM